MKKERERERGRGKSKGKLNIRYSETRREIGKLGVSALSRICVGMREHFYPRRET